LSAAGVVCNKRYGAVRGNAVRELWSTPARLKQDSPRWDVPPDPTSRSLRVPLHIQTVRRSLVQPAPYDRSGK